MIAESTPFGGIIEEGASNLGPNRAGFYGSSWTRWFLPVLTFIEKHDIRMWCYINCNWVPPHESFFPLSSVVKHGVL